MFTANDILHYSLEVYHVTRLRVSDLDPESVPVYQCTINMLMSAVRAVYLLGQERLPSRPEECLALPIRALYVGEQSETIAEENSGLENRRTSVIDGRKN